MIKCKPKFKLLSCGPKLSNDNGVSIGAKYHGHYAATNAVCKCGEVLLVAAPIFNPDHEPGDPVMVCADIGAHSYRFKELVAGRQPRHTHNN